MAATGGRCGCHGVQTRRAQTQFSELYCCLEIDDKSRCIRKTIPSDGSFARNKKKKNWF